MSLALVLHAKGNDLQEIHRLPAKKTWHLARNTKTGRFYSGEFGNIYCGKPSEQQNAIDRAKTNLAVNNEHTTVRGRYYSLRPWKEGDECLSDVELLDYLPVIRGELRFKELYHGTSGVAIYFTTTSGDQMTLRAACSDRFFQLVGEGRIKMDGSGFYTFDFTFVKASDKVFIELYGYE